MATNQVDVKAVITADDRASGVISNLGDVTKSAANKIAAGMAVAGAGLTLFAKSATDYTTDLVKSSKDLSRETGTSVENASQLIYVAQRMGITAEQASQTFGIFSKQIVAATDDIGKSSQAHAELQNKIDETKLKIKQTTDEIQKNGDKTGELNLRVKTLATTLQGQEKDLTASVNAFERLGVKVVDAQGHARSFNDILLDTSDKFKSLQNGSEKTALAMELFGRSGKDLLPLLNQGSAGIRDLEQRADKLGLTLNAQTIGSISRYIESQKNLTDSTNALKLAVGEATAPVLASFNNKIADIVNNLLASDSPMRGLTANVLAFGGPALSFTSAAIAMAANITTIATGATTATGAIAGMQATAALGVVLPVAGAVAALGALTFAAYETWGAIQKVEQGLNDLSNKKVSIGGGSGAPKVSGTSSAGLVQQLMNSFKGFATGGYTGRGGENDIAGVVHSGEYVVPKQGVNQATGQPMMSSGAPSQIYITVKAGAFMGNPQDARQYASLIFSALQDVASSKGMSLDELWRHNGVRTI